MTTNKLRALNQIALAGAAATYVVTPDMFLGFVDDAAIVVVIVLIEVLIHRAKGFTA